MDFIRISCATLGLLGLGESLERIACHETHSLAQNPILFSQSTSNFPLDFINPYINNENREMVLLKIPAFDILKK